MTSLYYERVQFGKFEGVLHSTMKSGKQENVTEKLRLDG